MLESAPEEYTRMVVGVMELAVQASSGYSSSPSTRSADAIIVTIIGENQLLWSPVEDQLNDYVMP